MIIGKEIRLKRFINKDNRTLIMPLDHGVEGVFDKLVDMPKIISKFQSKSDAFILRRGSINKSHRELNGKSIIMRISCLSGVAKPEMPTYESFISSIEEAIRLGADAIVATIWFGSTKENELVEAFGKLGDLCNKYGMPLIGECLIAPESGIKATDVNANIMASRTLSEEGADIVKVLYTGDKEGFKKVVDYSLVPIVTAGGDASGTDLEFLKNVEDMISAGAIGTSIGRNIWNRDNNIEILNAIDGIIKKNMTAKKAYEIFLK